MNLWKKMLTVSALWIVVLGLLGLEIITNTGVALIISATLGVCTLGIMVGFAKEKDIYLDDLAKYASRGFIGGLTGFMLSVIIAPYFGEPTPQPMIQVAIILGLPIICALLNASCNSECQC